MTTVLVACGLLQGASGALRVEDFNALSKACSWKEERQTIDRGNGSATVDSAVATTILFESGRIQIRQQYVSKVTFSKATPLSERLPQSKETVAVIERRITLSTGLLLDASLSDIPTSEVPFLKAVRPSMHGRAKKLTLRCSSPVRFDELAHRGTPLDQKEIDLGGGFGVRVDSLSPEELSDRLETVSTQQASEVVLYCSVNVGNELLSKVQRALGASPDHGTLPEPECAPTTQFYSTPQEHFTRWIESHATNLTVTRGGEQEVFLKPVAGLITKQVVTLMGDILANQSDDMLGFQILSFREGFPVQWKQVQSLSLRQAGSSRAELTFELKAPVVGALLSPTVNWKPWAMFSTAETTEASGFKVMFELDSSSGDTYLKLSETVKKLAKDVHVKGVEVF